MDRKLYGDEPAQSPASILPSVGDPEVEVDSQNNDYFYNYDTDAAAEGRST